MALWGKITQNEQFTSETEKSKDSQWNLGVTSQTDRHPENKESLIAPGLTIEGKIEGTGHVRIAGRFKGEVSVNGDLTIERGAHINGGIRAEIFVVRSEVK